MSSARERPHTRRRRAHLAALVLPPLLAACGLPGTAGAPGFVGGVYRDRVVVGDYGTIVGMAASQRMIFVASPSGLATYDRVAQQWLPPLTAADGYPADRITTLVGDPEVEGVWVGTLGEVLFYRPSIDQLIRTIVGTPVERIVFDRDDPASGAWVASAGAMVPMGSPASDRTLGASRAVPAGDGWMRVTHGGFASRVQSGEVPPPERWVETPTLESLAERMPALASFAELLTRDEALRSWRPSSATQVQGMSDVWLGTRGGGLYLADPVFNRARHVPFGLFEPGASALALASDGVWIASLGRDPRGTGGAAFTTVDLQQWRWVRGPADGALAGIAAYDVLVRNGRIWLATERGVVHRDLRADGGVDADWRWAPARGLRRAYALAVVDERVWAATDDGLILAGSADQSGTLAFPADASGAPAPVGTGQVRALATTGDTLWLATSSGLSVMRTAGGVPTVTRVALTDEPAWLRGSVIGLARSDSVLVAATSGRIALIEVGTRAVRSLPGNPDVTRVGRLISVAIDAHTVWVGGERGAMVIDRNSGLARSADAPGVAAEPVFDIALQPEFAWLATPSGVVRIRRMPDGGIR